MECGSVGSRLGHLERSGGEDGAGFHRLEGLEVEKVVHGQRVVQDRLQGCDAVPDIVIHLVDVSYAGLDIEPLSLLRLHDLRPLVRLQCPVRLSSGAKLCGRLCAGPTLRLPLDLDQ